MEELDSFSGMLAGLPAVNIFRFQDKVLEFPNTNEVKNLQDKLFNPTRINSSVYGYYIGIALYIVQKYSEVHISPVRGMTHPDTLCILNDIGDHPLSEELYQSVSHIRYYLVAWHFTHPFT